MECGGSTPPFERSSLFSKPDFHMRTAAGSRRWPRRYLLISVLKRSLMDVCFKITGLRLPSVGRN